MTTLNTTGIEPTEFNVLVRMEKAKEKTVGGIILPDEKKDRDQAMLQRGTMIAASPLAFTYDSWTDCEHLRPEVGDGVLISKGAGLYIPDLDDGETYRLLKDKDICAVIKPKVAAARAKAA